MTSCVEDGSRCVTVSDHTPELCAESMDGPLRHKLLVDINDSASAGFPPSRPLHYFADRATTAELKLEVALLQNTRLWSVFDRLLATLKKHVEHGRSASAADAEGGTHESADDAERGTYESAGDAEQICLEETLELLEETRKRARYAVFAGALMQVVLKYAVCRSHVLMHTVTNTLRGILDELLMCENPHVAMMMMADAVKRACNKLVHRCVASGRC
jgi:hypothetical protein